MSLVIDLPKDISLTLLRNWLSLRDIVKLDSAISSEELRNHWLELLSNEIITCSTVNLRDKDLSKIKWLMSRNSFCNKIAFRSSKLRDLNLPNDFLIKWIRQSTHLKTLRFKEKSNVTFQVLLQLLLIPFLQKKSTTQEDLLNLQKEQVKSQKLLVELGYGLFKLEEDGEVGGSLKTEAPLLPYAPILSTEMHRFRLQHLNEFSSSTRAPGNSAGSTEMQRSGPLEAPISNPFPDLSLSPIPVIEQADSLPHPPTSSLETELMTANIAHPFTAMEVIERMIQRTLVNLREQQRHHQQQFYQQQTSTTPRRAKASSKGGKKRPRLSSPSASFQDEGNDSSFIDPNSTYSTDQIDMKEEIEAESSAANNANTCSSSSFPSTTTTTVDLLNADNLPSLQSVPVTTVLPLSDQIDQAPAISTTEETVSLEELLAVPTAPNLLTSPGMINTGDKPLRNQESNDNSSENNSGEEELNHIMMDSNPVANTSLSDGLLLDRKKRFTALTAQVEVKLDCIFQNIEELYFHFHDMSLLTSFFLQSLLPRVPKLRTFTMIDCMKVFDSDVSLLVQCCPQLEELSIDNCSMIQGLFFPVMVQKASQLNKIVLKHGQVISRATPNPPANVEELFALPQSGPHRSWSAENALLCSQTVLSHREMVSRASSSSSSSSLSMMPLAGQRPVKYHTKLLTCDFTHSREIGDYLLPFLLFYCPNIERINVSFCHLASLHFQYLSLFSHRLKVLFVPGNTIDDDVIVPIATHCRQLESMVVGFSPRVTEVTIEAIAKHLSQLKTFALWGNHKALNETSMMHLVKGCTLLEKVALTYTGTTDEVLDILVSHCPLTRIEVNGCQLLSDRSIASLAKHCSERLTHFVAENVLFTDEGCRSLSECHVLEYINLNSSKLITAAGICLIVRNCPKIEVLKLKECQLMTDEVLFTLSDYGKELRELDISYVKHFSLEAILAVVNRCPHLHKLFMVACFQDHLTHPLNDQDTIQEIVRLGTEKKIHIIH